jgi:deoxyribonuclease-4
LLRNIFFIQTSRYFSHFLKSCGSYVVKLGVHVSISGTIDQAFDNARQLGCETFQMFTRNPRGWKFRKLDADEVKEFRRKGESYGLSPVVTHMPYLPNLSSPKKVIYNKSLKSLTAEFDRCATLGIPYIVTHLGSHLGKGADIGLERLTAAINTVLAEDSGGAILLLENTAGTKNSMGSTFEEIKRIIDGIEDKGRVGVCFDTAHAFAAGYDLRTPHGVDDTIGRFDSVLGIKLLKVVHLNDSKGPQGSGRDRHEHLGLGYIGDQGFRALFKHEEIRDLPFIMETPIDENGDELRDLRKARELAA